MLEARLYARISKDEEKNGKQSIPAQIANLENYCKENKIKVNGLYIDDGISAATIKKRKDFCRLLDDLKDGEIILFTNLDRFSRDILDANMLIKKFKEKDIKFKAILEADIDVTTADGKFMFNIMVSMAMREREKTAERIRNVNKHKVTEGTLLSGRMQIGYDNIDKRAVTNEKEAEFVKWVFDYYELHQSIRKVTFDSQSIHGVTLTYQTISKMIGDERYTGMYRNNPNFFPTIIQKDQFDRVKKIRSRNIKRYKTDRVYLFTGLLICPECGGKLSGGIAKTMRKDGNKKEHHIYRCNRFKVSHRCSNNKTVSSNLLEKYLLINTQELLNSYIKEMQISEQKVKVDTNQNLINQCKRKIKRLQELYIAEMIEIDDYTREYDELNAIINHEEERISTYSSVKDNIEKYTEFINMDLKNVYSNLSNENKRSFWRALIDHIEIREDRSFSIFFK